MKNLYTKNGRYFQKLYSSEERYGSTFKGLYKWRYIIKILWFCFPTSHLFWMPEDGFEKVEDKKRGVHDK